MLRALGVCLILAPLRPAAPFEALAVTPADGDVLTSAPAEILVTLSDAIDAASVDGSTVRLTGAGPDEDFDTADDVRIVAASVGLLGPNQIRVNLTGVPLSNGAYRLTVLADPPIHAGRVAWWKFDESSGTAVKDSSGSGNHGTIGGNPLWMPGGGRIGGALDFDGSGDFVFVPRSASLEPAGSMSVSLWARITSAAGGFTDILRKAGEDDPGYLVRWHHFDDHLQWRLDRDANPDIYAPDPQATAAYLNAWRHVAAVYDAASGTSSLYVDGVLRASVTGFSGSLEHSDDLFLMWSDHGGQVALPGRLDDVRVYGRALTLAEIQSLAAGVSDEAVLDLFGSPLAAGAFVSTFTLAPNSPAAPSLLLATPGNGGAVDLTWSDNATNETGFTVERSDDGILFVSIATLAADVEAYQDLPPGPSFYRVRAFNASGASAASNVASAATGGVSTSNIFIENGCGLGGLELVPLLWLSRRRRRA